MVELVGCGRLIMHAHLDGSEVGKNSGSLLELGHDQKSQESPRKDH